MLLFSNLQIQHWTITVFRLWNVPVWCPTGKFEYHGVRMQHLTQTCVKIVLTWVTVGQTGYNRNHTGTLPPLTDRCTATIPKWIILVMYLQTLWILMAVGIMLTVLSMWYLVDRCTGNRQNCSLRIESGILVAAKLLSFMFHMTGIVSGLCHAICSIVTYFLPTFIQ